MTDKLAAWNVREEDFPVNGNQYDQIKGLLRYAVLAPSGPNTQPWKLSINGNEVSLITDFDRALPNVDPSNRTLYLSHGCLLANILLAAEHFGFGYDVSYLPDGPSGERTAAIKLTKPAGPKKLPDLFAQITRRHTNRKEFETRAIEEATLKELRACVQKDGVDLNILTDEAGKSAMSEILARAHKIQLGNKTFRKELASWVRPNTGDEKDGLPGYSFGYTDFESYFGSFIFGTFDMSSSRARIETAYMKASPAVGVLSTDQDDMMTWLKAGFLFQILFLKATEMDVRFDLFSQPIAIPELREDMARILKVKYPQLLIRMGYAEPSKHTPRRPLEEVLVS